MHKVMLVEDDPTMLSLLKTLMEIEGFQVVNVVDFEQIIDEIRQNIPDLILLDVHLGDISGFEVLEKLRQDEQLQNVVVIMSSGMDVQKQCIEKGADDFVLKPYMPDELIMKIKQKIVERLN